MARRHRRRRTNALAGALVLAACVSHAQGADALAGRQKAQSCSTCHGPLGISQLPNAPHLAGQPAIYVIEQLKAYRNGKRANEMMNVVAKPLSDRDIEDLAAWYASIEVSAKPPN